MLRKFIKVVTEDRSKSEYDSALLKLLFFPPVCGPYLSTDLSKTCSTVYFLIALKIFFFFWLNDLLFLAFIWARLAHVASFSTGWLSREVQGGLIHALGGWCWLAAGAPPFRPSLGSSTSATFCWPKHQQRQPRVKGWRNGPHLLMRGAQRICGHLFQSSTEISLSFSLE